MKKLATVIVVVGLNGTPGFAADMAVKAPPPPPTAVWDWSGFYIGGGGSFNWSHFDQSLQGVSGTINVSIGPVLVAQGQEGGPFFDGAFTAISAAKAGVAFNPTSTETNLVSPLMSRSDIWFRFPAATGW